MALAVNSTGSNTGPSGGESATGSFSFTNTAGTVLFIAVSGFRNRTISTLTYNGVSLTSVVRSATGGASYTEWFRLLSPATGSNTVAWTLSGTDGPTFGLISFTGNDTTTPVGTTGSSQNVTNSITTTISTVGTGSIVIDASYVNAANTRTVGAGQTQAWNVNDAQYGTEGSVGSYESAPSAGSVTMSWGLSTSVQWTQAVLEVRAAAASAPDLRLAFI
jgi:hypothetical protein